MFILLLATCLIAGAVGYSHLVTPSVEKAFTEAGKHKGYDFVFSNEVEVGTGCINEIVKEENVKTENYGLMGTADNRNTIKHRKKRAEIDMEGREWNEKADPTTSSVQVIDKGAVNVTITGRKGYFILKDSSENVNIAIIGVKPGSRDRKKCLRVAGPIPTSYYSNKSKTSYKDLAAAITPAGNSEGNAIQKAIRI